jgi:hypothetical protein
MSGRPPKDDGKQRVTVHTNQGYRYACTQPCTIDEKTGKRKYRRIHWGTITEDMKFIPSSRYIYAEAEEKASLAFPNEWDMSAAERLPENRKPGRPAYDGEDKNRLYGDIWLLERIAEKTGIRQDLEKVFGNKGIVDDIMTLAMFPYLTNYSFNRVARWQVVAKSPSDRALSPTDITRLTQSITEQQRMDLLRLRAMRLGKHAVCAVDSTTRSAYGRSLADIHWGKNKEGLPLAQTVEVVVYTFDTHIPVYYRTFPGNMLDSRSLGTILLDLSHAGFSDIVLITDRGYETIRNLEQYILQGQAMILCTKVQQRHVLSRILSFGAFNMRPEGMEIDRDMRLYYQQYDMDYPVESTGGSTKQSDRLKLNLYFDAVRRSEELTNLDIDIQTQGEQLEALLSTSAVMDDDATLKRMYRYFKIQCDPSDRSIKSYELNKTKIDKAKQSSGFFAIVTHKLDMKAMDVLHTYRIRDEQEKCFQQMKSQMDGARQRNWSEEGKSGRQFIQFVSLILSAYARSIWRSTALKDKFSSSLEVFDEMRSIRCIEHTGRTKWITPFVGDQLAICDAFGFDVPDGCSPVYESKQKSPKRRGRPRKKLIEVDL